MQVFPSPLVSSCGDSTEIDNQADRAEFILRYTQCISCTYTQKGSPFILLREALVMALHLNVKVIRIINIVMNVPLQVIDLVFLEQSFLFCFLFLKKKKQSPQTQNV